MIVISQIGWSRYHNFEGPFFGGDFKQLKVPPADRGDTFAKKVLSITAAAEGGSWSSINMYDSGLVSVGAMQFIDVAPQFGVTRMLGEVAERCGLEPLLEALKPALDLSNAMFVQTPQGWRFTLDVTPVTTRAQQCELFFGDAAGNAYGSFNDGKKNRAKTWAACMANVWYIPGAVEAQSEYCLRRLMNDFTWGNLRSELFNANVDADGWVGATRALLLAYAVNAPAIVVKRYEAVRNNPNPKFSPQWCLEVLRGVVVDGGVDVWRARWSAKIPLVARAFGVTMPTYVQLVARAWQVAPPVPLPIPNVEPAPDLQPWVVLPEDPALEPSPEPTPPAPSPPFIVVRENQGIIAMVMNFVKIIVEVVTRALGR